MNASGATAYLVNTGWNGTGERISLKETRNIINAILDGTIDKAETKTLPYFNLELPISIPGVSSDILDPRDTYANSEEWDKKAKELANMFITNFEQFATNEEGKSLISAGPKF